MIKIALTGGGTAGHITPNLALIPELKKRGYEIIYIGSKNGMEKDICARHNIPFFGINADKLRRYFDIKNFFMPINVIKGINDAKKILKTQNINVVFSKGGFVAVPVVIAASMLHIPIVSHEADFTPGLANKIAAPLSKYVCCNFEETANNLKNKGIYTGSPIRNELLNGNREKGQKLLNFQNNKPVVFVTGGSLGSAFINNLIRTNLDILLPYVNIVHSCGKNKIDNGISKNGYKQFELITDDLPDIFAASDLIISRAGANIIFELLALKKLNLLIPLSLKASRGDQILNAKYFEKKKYSVVLFEDEQEKNPNLFFEKLKEIKNREDDLLYALNNSKADNASYRICDIIDKCISNL